MREFHTIPPLYNENSKILILGSFPSVKSRETEFFYGHPQNRFWKVMAALFREKIPESTEEKKSLLLSHGVALWDAVYSCDIVGSSDSSIKNVIPNDILFILSKTSVSKIFLNGKTAEKYYKKYINTYTKEDQYYDDAFYQLGMLYYENGDLENAKKTFYGMRSEVPDSMYNNSKVKEILSK